MHEPGSPAHARFWTTLERLLLPAAIAAMLLFLFIGIGRPIWVDEANSLSIAGAGLPGMLEKLRNDNNFPIYYILLYGWTHWFGDSEISLRLLSGIFYVAAIASMYAGALWLGLDRRSALYCSFFYLVSSLAVRHAQNVRMYSLLGFLSAASASLYCGQIIKKDVSRSSRFLYGLVTTAGLLTHVWFFFVVLAQLIAAAVWCGLKRAKPVLAIAVVSIAMFAILWGPSFYTQLHNGATDWMPRFQAWLIPSALLGFYCGYPIGVLLYAWAFMCARRKSGQANPAADATRSRIWVSCAVISILVPLAISTVKPIYWPGRYAIIALPPIAFALASALAQRAPRHALVLTSFGLLTLTVMAHISLRDIHPETSLPSSQSERAAAQFLIRHARPGDAVIFADLGRASTDYYFRRSGAALRYAEISFPRENESHLGWRDLAPLSRRREVLLSEARDIVRRLQTRRQTTWVMFGSGLKTGIILKDELDTSLQFRAEYSIGEASNGHPGLIRILEYSPDDAPVRRASGAIGAD